MQKESVNPLALVLVNPPYQQNSCYLEGQIKETWN